MAVSGVVLGHRRVELTREQVATVNRAVSPVSRGGPGTKQRAPSRRLWSQTNPGATFTLHLSACDLGK